MGLRIINYTIYHGIEKRNANTPHDVICNVIKPIDAGKLSVR